MSDPEAPLGTRRIVGLFPELIGIGGVQEASRLTASALHELSARHNFSFDLLSLNDPSGRQLLEVGNHAIEFRGFARAKARFVLSAVGSCVSLAKGATSLVLAAHPHLAVPAAWMQKASPRLKSIVMTHGVEVWEPLQPARHRALLRSNLVLAPSHFTLQKLIDVQRVSPEKVRKLAWPLNPKLLEMSDNPENLPLPSGFPQGRIILTVGRWSASERYKGTDDLIRAVSSLRAVTPDLDLVAVGGGDDLPRLQQLAAELSIADRVHFFENLSREELSACYAHSDLFALPSTGEGFGLVFLEAMAFGKAVVGVSSGGVVDIVEDQVTGLLVPAHDPSALAQALGRLLGNQSLRQEMGRRGAEAVRQRYSFAAFRRNLEQILRELISESSASQ